MAFYITVVVTVGIEALVQGYWTLNAKCNPCMRYTNIA